MRPLFQLAQSWHLYFPNNCMFLVKNGGMIDGRTTIVHVASGINLNIRQYVSNVW